MKVMYPPVNLSSVLGFTFPAILRHKQAGDDQNIEQTVRFELRRVASTGVVHPALFRSDPS
jgi:hypothetical protein